MVKGKDCATQDGDLQLIALMVAKRLREEHLDNDGPASGDFRVRPSEQFGPVGTEVQVDIRIGRDLCVRLYDFWREDEVRDLGALAAAAEAFADKIHDVRRGTADTQAMMSEVRAAVRREISKANRRGLAYELTSLELFPILASGPDDTSVRVEHRALGRSLRSEPFAFHAESADDVASAFASIAEEQRRRAKRRHELDLIGATGTIDSVVVAALTAAGLDMPTLLAKLRDSDDWIVDVDTGADTRLRLHWNEGAVRSWVELAKGVRWHEGTLWMDAAPRAVGRLAKGTLVSEVLQHPFLDEGLRVRSGTGSKGERATIRCEEVMLNFDADTGRLCPA